MTSPAVFCRAAFVLLLALSAAPAVRSQAPDTQERRAFLLGLRRGDAYLAKLC